VLSERKASDDAGAEVLLEISGYWSHAARRCARGPCLNQYGNSRQLRFIEKWFPGERLSVGIVKMSFLQKLAYTSEVFTKE
jgi:hypothetical protein